MTFIQKRSPGEFREEKNNFKGKEENTMSHSISNLKYSLHLSKEANEFLMENFVRVIPSEEFKSQLPLPLKNVQVKSFIPRKILAENFIDLIQEMDIRNDDVFVCSLPKSGSSWTETIVWFLKQGSNFESNQSNKRQKSVSGFEIPATFKANANELQANDQSLTESEALKMAWSMHFEQLESPRIIKTHVPVYALPKAIWTKQTKLIYVVRNPKDMTVSEYHYRRNYLPPADIKIDDVVDGITMDLWPQSPRAQHILNFWNLRHLPNILFVAYEDLVRDSFANIKKISEFLECKYTDQQLQKLTDLVSFKNMKENKTLNKESLITDVERTYGVKRLDASFT